jgi:hypothetical protein
LRQQVGRRHRILDRQVDAHAAHRRHRMRRIADAQQARPRPLRHAVDLHLQQLDVVPARQPVHVVGQEVGDAGHGARKASMPCACRCASEPFGMT